MQMLCQFVGRLPSFLPHQSLRKRAGAKQSRGGKLGSPHNNTTESGLDAFRIVMDTPHMAKG